METTESGHSLNISTRRDSKENVASSSYPLQVFCNEPSPTHRLDIVETNPMPSASQEQTEEVIRPCSPSNLVVYRYRFLILVIYGLYSGASLYQLNQFTIIGNVVFTYYNTTIFVVSLSQLVFMITLIIFIWPVVRIVEGIDLRIAGLMCSGITFVGAVMKVFGTEPNQNDFIIIVIAQCVCGFAQVFTIILPAKVVAVWFPAEEQNRACAAALFGGEIGMLLGSVLPILFVHNRTTIEELKQGIFQLILYNAIFCGLAFLIVLLFFRSKPPSPPSAQQFHVGNHKTEFYAAFYDLSVNNDFFRLVVLYGFACGLWNVFGITENIIYLNYFPDSLIDLSSITAITSISGGLIGNFLFGYILDKTLQYKLFTFMIFLSMAMSYGVLATCFEMKWHWPSYLMTIVFGFFSSSSINISFQYLAEVTFPISEVVPIAVLQVTQCLVTIVYQITYSFLLEKGYFKLVHGITVATFLAITGGTYFMTSKLKRMLVKPRQE